MSHRLMLQAPQPAQEVSGRMALANWACLIEVSDYLYPAMIGNILLILRKYTLQDAEAKKRGQEGPAAGTFYP